MAIDVWRMLGCELDWNGLAVACEIYGIDDVETLVQMLMDIREEAHKHAEQRAKHG